nr:hypothetical protein CoNPh38_CDS0197 [Staphylococcus phage S-CoN_Ph38]
MYLSLMVEILNQKLKNYKFKNLRLRLLLHQMNLDKNLVMRVLYLVEILFKLV